MIADQEAEPGRRDGTQGRKAGRIVGQEAEPGRRDGTQGRRGGNGRRPGSRTRTKHCTPHPLCIPIRRQGNRSGGGGVCLSCLSAPWMTCRRVKDDHQQGCAPVARFVFSRSLRPMEIKMLQAMARSAGVHHCRCRCRPVPEPVPVSSGMQHRDESNGFGVSVCSLGTSLGEGNTIR
jgi:hypothetical protein